MLYACVFNLTYLITCSVVFYKQGDLTDVASQVICGLSLLVTLLTLIAFALKPTFFLRFRFSFKRETRAFIHYFFHIVAITLSILCICLLPDLLYLSLAPPLFMMIYTVAYKPYKELVDNLRSAFNYLCMMVTSAMLLFYSFTDDSTKTSWSGFIFPVLLLLMLLASVIWAGVLVIQDIYLGRCKSPETNLAYKLFDKQ